MWIGSTRGIRRRWFLWKELWTVEDACRSKLSQPVVASVKEKDVLAGCDRKEGNKTRWMPTPNSSPVEPKLKGLFDSSQLYKCGNCGCAETAETAADFTVSIIYSFWCFSILKANFFLLFTHFHSGSFQGLPPLWERRANLMTDLWTRGLERFLWNSFRTRKPMPMLEGTWRMSTACQSRRSGSQRIRTGARAISRRRKRPSRLLSTINSWTAQFAFDDVWRVVCHLSGVTNIFFNYLFYQMLFICRLWMFFQY